MNKSQFFLLFFLCTILTNTNAKPLVDEPCKVINWLPYHSYEIRTTLHKRTHIFLPEPIQGEPIPGNPVLWDVKGEDVHLFIKPKNYGNREGRETTVTAVTLNNNSFDFDVIRVKRNYDRCVVIKKDEGAMNIGKNGWADPGKQNNVVNQKLISELKTQLIKEKKQKQIAIEKALSSYRHNIHTRYSWEVTDDFFEGNIISDVWDDGRFTYIRLLNDNLGQMQINAGKEKEGNVIQYTYDNKNKIYSIPGLYEYLTMTYEENYVYISRNDNNTNGGY